MRSLGGIKLNAFKVEFKARIRGAARTQHPKREIRREKERGLWLILKLNQWLFLCGPRLLNVATGGVWDSFVLLPRILGCWGFFARAFLLGRLDFLYI